MAATAARAVLGTAASRSLAVVSTDPCTPTSDGRCVNISPSTSLLFSTPADTRSKETGSVPLAARLRAEVVTEPPTRFSEVGRFLAFGRVVGAAVAKLAIFLHPRYPAVLLLNTVSPLAPVQWYSEPACATENACRQKQPPVHSKKPIRTATSKRCWREQAPACSPLRTTAFMRASLTKGSGQAKSSLRLTQIVIANHS